MKMVLKTLKLSLLMLIVAVTNAAAQCINTFPNTETFEAGPVWTVAGTNPDWAWGTPSKPVITGAGGGTKCWLTAGLTSSVYVNSEQAYIKSPCYDFTSLTFPHVRFKIFWETEYKYDGGNLQYSINNGTTWINVGAVNDPVNCMTANWYNYATITYLNNPAWISTKNGWAGNIQASYPSGVTTCQGGNGSGAWVEAQHCLNGLAGQSNVIFRFTFGSGTTCNSYDGLAIDDFTIENGPPNAPTFTFACSGNNAVAFTSANPPCPTPTTYAWNFGDAASGASNTSALANPTHTFSTFGVYNVTLTTSGGPCNPPGSTTNTVTITSVSAIKTDVTCNGLTDGTATATANGGSGPYTYSWAAGGQTTAAVTGLGIGTYTVNVTEANSCPSSTTVTITQPTAIAVTASATPVSCFGGTDGTATAAPTGGTAPYTYLWAPTGGTAITATGLSTGTYTVTVNDAHNCSITGTTTVTQPLAALTSSATSTPGSCSGAPVGSITVTAAGGTSPYTYTWNPSVSVTNTASALAAGTYTISVKDAHNCTSVVTSTVVQPASGLTVSATATPVSCFGGNDGTATANASGGTMPYTYSWNPSASTLTTVSALTVGTYTVTVTDSSGCTATANSTVTQPAAALSVTASATPATCFGASTGSVTATAANGTAPYTYLWAAGGATTATVAGLAAATYTVTVTDAHTCTTTGQTNVTQPAALTASATSTPVSCFAGNDGTATVTALGGTSPYTYVWAPSGETSATATSLTAGAYTVTVNDANSCNTTASVNIAQPAAALTVTAVNTNITCFGGNNGAIALTVSGGTSPYMYVWAPAVSVTANATGLIAGTYTTNVTDAHGCPFVSTNTLTQPATAITVSSVITPVKCYGGNTGSITATAVNGIGPYTYSWAPGGATTSTLSALAIGTYTITVTDANNCTVTSIDTIIQPALLSTLVSNTAVKCFGGTDGTATAVCSGGVAPYTYSWAPSGATTATATGLISGIYTVTITDANNCSINNSTSVAQPASALSTVAVNTNITCFGGSNGSITLIGSGGTAPYTYAWTPSVTTTSSDAALAAGTYSITITDANGCAFLSTNTLTQPATAVTATTTSTPALCTVTNGTATVNATGGTSPYTYSWSHVGATSADATGLATGSYTVNVTDANSCAISPTVVVSDSGSVGVSVISTQLNCFGDTTGTASASVIGGTSPFTYTWSNGKTIPTLSHIGAGTYCVKIKDVNGCRDSACTTLVNPPATEAQFIANPNSADITNPAIQFIDQSANAAIWQWSFGDSTSSAVINPVHTFGDVGAYPVTLIVTNAKGCKDTAMQVVNINEIFTFYAPNAITPDGNGDNDVFLPKGTYWDPNKFTMYVFDRWGNMIFHSTEMYKGWNGIVEGASELVQQDVYVWKVKLSDLAGRIHNYIGSVTVVK
jgi:gliding motility-associated-like protein